MFEKLSDEIREFYRLAEEARQWALESTDPGMRRDLVLVERSWLLLAHSYEHSEALTVFTSSQQRGRKKA